MKGISIWGLLLAHPQNLATIDVLAPRNFTYSCQILAGVKASSNMTANLHRDAYFPGDDTYSAFFTVAQVKWLPLQKIRDPS